MKNSISRVYRFIRIGRIFRSSSFLPGSDTRTASVSRIRRHRLQNFSIQQQRPFIRRRMQQRYSRILLDYFPQGVTISRALSASKDFIYFSIIHKGYIGKSYFVIF